MIITQLEEDDDDLKLSPTLLSQLEQLNRLDFDSRYDLSRISQLPSAALADATSSSYQRIIDLLYNLVEPSGEWIWYKTELSDAERWNSQEKFIKSIPLLLQLLNDLINSAANDTNLKPTHLKIIQIIAYYKCVEYPWSSLSSYNIACELERSISEVNATEVSQLMDIIKPLFSNPTHEQVSSTGRRKFTRSVNSKFVTNESEAVYRKPWRSNFQWSIAILEYAMINLKTLGPSEAVSSLVKQCWALLIPSILNIIDDSEALIKSKGCIISNLLFDVVDEKFFDVTGVGPIFWDALKPCLLYLPPITPPEVTIILIPTCIQSLLTLVNKDSTDKQLRFSRLNEIIRDGIFKGISQSGQQNVDVLIMFLEEIKPIADEFNVEVIRHLKQLIGIFTNILCDPFISLIPRLTIATCEAMIAVMNNGWIRIEEYKYDILQAIVKCWQGQRGEKHSNEEIINGLQSIIYKLETIIGKDLVRSDYIELISYDERLNELFKID